eukprot:9117780-Pyramimonas_sp.AAC.1
MGPLQLRAELPRLTAPLRGRGHASPILRMPCAAAARVRRLRRQRAAWAIVTARRVAIARGAGSPRRGR